MGFQRAVQRQELPRHLLLRCQRPVAGLDGEVPLEEVHHRQVARRLAVRYRAGLEDEPAVDAVRVCDLPDQARLPDARLADDGDDLAVTRRRARERLVQCLEFGLPPDY